MQALPYTGLLPIPQSTPAGHARAAAHFQRQHAPRDARTQYEDNAGQGGAVGYRWPAAASPRSGLGQQGFNDDP